MTEPSVTFVNDPMPLTREQAMDAAALGRAMQAVTDGIPRYVIPRLDELLATVRSITDAETAEDRAIAKSYADTLHTHLKATEGHYAPYNKALHSAHARCKALENEIAKPIKAEIDRLKALATPPVEEAGGKVKLAWECASNDTGTVAAIVAEIVVAYNKGETVNVGRLLKFLALNKPELDAALVRSGEHMNVPGVRVVATAAKPRVKQER